jgi:ferredoxin-type protein NapH
MVSMAKNKSHKFAAWLARWRTVLQLGFLLAWLDPLAMRMHSFCGPVFHCYACPLATFACPIGVLANFSALHMIPFAAIGVLVVSGAIFGSFICGWACPFGFLQDLVAKVPTPKFALPAWMSVFRYVVLAALVVAVPYYWGEDSSLFFCRLCPASAAETVLPNMATQVMNQQAVVWPSIAKGTIFAVLVVAMFFTWRPWCTVLCPLGAIYSLLNRFSFFFLRFEPNLCIDCKDCHSLCRDSTDAEHRIDGTRCVRCLDCAKCRAVTIGTVFTPLTSPKTKSPPVDRPPTLDTIEPTQTRA